MSVSSAFRRAGKALLIPAHLFRDAYRDNRAVIVGRWRDSAAATVAACTFTAVVGFEESVVYGAGLAAHWLAPAVSENDLTRVHTVAAVGAVAYGVYAALLVYPRVRATLARKWNAPVGPVNG